MLHVTDDMDDMFRKAAKDYPLNTENADWNAVREKMEAAAPQKPKEKGNTFRNLLLLLLLLLVPLYFLFNRMDRPLSPPRIPGSASASPANPTAANNVDANFVASQPVARGNEPKAAVYNDANVISHSGDDNNTYHHNNGNNTHIGKVVKRKINHQVKESDAALTETLSNDGISKGKTRSSVSSKTNISISPSTAEENEDDGSANLNNTSVVDETMAGTPIQKEKLTEKPVNEKAVPAPAAVKEKKKASKHFYAGIIGGPDVTSVKLQSVKKAGLSYGLVAGYRLNKRWEMETGLMVDKKYYDTDGKYFNTKDIPLPNYIKIDHATGDCDMLEIPVNIRYNFRKRSGSGWFASAGISSYLMKEEYYDYAVTRYGVSYNREYTYNESRNSFISVMNLSGGYSRRLGKIGDLRIEPYIKLPIKKVGIGSLPLQSAGVYISFTRMLF